jgi:hypothetical protein
MRSIALFYISTFVLGSIFFFTPLWAGPNGSASCAVDMNYTTQKIESNLKAKMNDNIWIAIVAQNVTNLDTYQVEVKFDVNRLKFLGGVEDNSMSGIVNLLKTNGGQTIGFQTKERRAGTVNISNALVGTDSKQAPEGSGIIALLNFKVLDAKPDNGLLLFNVHFLDSKQFDDNILNLKNAYLN